MSQGDTGSPAKGATTQAESNDSVIDTLKKIAKILEDDRKTGVALREDLAAFLKSLIPDQPPVPGDDGCDKPEPFLAKLCAQRRFDLASADSSFESQEVATSATLVSAISDWKLARSQYDLDVANAEGDLGTAIKTAKDANRDQRPDSPSRSLFLYFQMETAVTNALIAYETAMATAAGKLAAASGALTAAYVTYTTSVGGDAANWLNARATAFENFWQAVENARDSS